MSKSAFGVDHGDISKGLGGFKPPPLPGMAHLQDKFKPIQNMAGAASSGFKGSAGKPGGFGQSSTQKGFNAGAAAGQKVGGAMKKPLVAGAAGAAVGAGAMGAKKQKKF